MKPLTSEARDQLDQLLRSCIHCGLCLGDCPTYLATGNEAESPRGRLMILAELEKLGVAHPDSKGQSALAGRAPSRGPLDRCLGCLHCETVCPSGVQYGTLLERGREQLGPAPGWRARMGVLLVDEVLSRPTRLRPFARLGHALRRMGAEAWLPPPFGGLLRSLPKRALPAVAQWRPRTQGNVAILAGCAQQVFEPEVLEASFRLIEAAGFVPFVPRDQSCCGAMSHHAGSTQHAREQARRLIDSLQDCSSVVIPSAGCSAHMRHYGEIFAGDADYAGKAQRVAEASVDLVVWLDRHGERLRFSADERRVIYHPPCHHRHAQDILDEAPRLLARVPKLELLTIRDAERCCGSAGAYSLLQPELAAELRAEKLARIREIDPQLVLTANPGCEFFLESGLTQAAGGPPVRHLAVYLAQRLMAEDC